MGRAPVVVAGREGKRKLRIYTTAAWRCGHAVQLAISHGPPGPSASGNRLLGVGIIISHKHTHTDALLPSSPSRAGGSPTPISAARRRIAASGQTVVGAWAKLCYQRNARMHRHSVAFASDANTTARHPRAHRKVKTENTLTHLRFPLSPPLFSPSNVSSLRVPPSPSPKW